MPARLGSRGGRADSPVCDGDAGIRVISRLGGKLHGRSPFEISWPRGLGIILVLLALVAPTGFLGLMGGTVNQARLFQRERSG